MAKKLNKNHPLVVELVDDKVVISIGYAALVYAVTHRYDPEYRNYKVTDPLGFAKDIVRQILEESEIGESAVTELFDNAAQTLVDNGDTTAIEYKNKK